MGAKEEGKAYRAPKAREFFLGRLFVRIKTPPMFVHSPLNRGGGFNTLNSIDVRGFTTLQNTTLCAGVHNLAKHDAMCRDPQPCKTRRYVRGSTTLQNTTLCVGIYKSL
jgi:hypothetical protein